MGIFSWLKAKPRVPREQLSYDVANHIFPHYAFQQLDTLVSIIKTSPDTAGGIFYLIACKSKDILPVREEANLFKLHQGQIDEIRSCLIMEYPQPKPINYSGQSFTDFADEIRGGNLVIAPYFSAVVRHSGSGHTDYFVLGQTSTGGGTVIRRIDCEGTNESLGAGPEPKLNLFLVEIKRHLAGRT